MPEISEAIRAFAEEPDRFVHEPPAPVHRIRRASFTLMLSPTRTMSNVSCVRTSEGELDATIAEAREVIRAKGYTRNVWSIGPSTRPHGLAALLAARGFVPADRPPFESSATAMALVRPPPRPPAGVEARAVRDFEEYLEMWRLAVEVFNESAEAAAGWLAAAPALWTQLDGVNRFAYVAVIDRKPVGFAFAVGGPSGLLLGGGGVMATARGNGAYRALLAARWTDAVRLGKPALVIHAGAMSRPIVARSGFEPVCEVLVMEDTWVGQAG
jgi:hypothetical protein